MNLLLKNNKGFMNPNYEIQNFIVILAVLLIIAFSVCGHFKIHPLWGVGAVVLFFIALQICIRIADTRWEKEHAD